MKTLLKHLSCFCLFFIFGANYAIAQNYQHDFDQVVKKVDDLLWYEKVGDIAHIDKVYLCGPARWKETNPTGMSAGNELKFWTYIFIPKSVDPDKKYPLIVLPHSGVHADFNTYYAHIVRELIAQEYIVVSAEYRGSTGYGKATYDNIDYGGLENEDVYVSRNYMVENFDIVDANRIGIMGWSHGGMITLMIIGKSSPTRAILGRLPGRIWRNTNAAHRSGTRKNYKIPCSSIPILATMT